MHSGHKYSSSEAEEKHRTAASHFVCTLAQAESLIDSQKRFWVSNCGCREENRGCEYSRLDVCLFFKPEGEGTGSGFKKIDKEFARGILKEARERRLVPRPFRDENDRNQIGGICFCCPDCCSYFQNEAEICEKGDFIEKTDNDACIACGTCTDVCCFGARKINNGELFIDRSLCFGCGLCAEVCPMHCISMILRPDEGELAE